VRNLDGPEKILKELYLMDKAASSISDGDLVDSLIHGYGFINLSAYAALTVLTAPNNIGV